MPATAVHARFDTPGGGSQVDRGLVTVTGWAFAADGLLRSARVVVDDGQATPVQLGLWRADVEEAARLWPQAASSGFTADVDLRSVVGDAAHLALLVRTADGSWAEAATLDLRLTPLDAPAPGTRPRAAFTIVKDEAPMLDVWLRHYGRHFAPEDLYVLDHDSTDGGTLGLEGRCHVVPVHRDVAFEHRWLRTTVQDFQRLLLGSYATVLFAEVDEMVLVDPRHHADLGAYIDAMAKPSARCSGFNVVHRPGEPPLDHGRPILEQRSTWHASLEYSKRLISRVPLRWADGFHRELSLPDDAPDPHLLLVHLHRADHDACLARHEASAARAWSATDVDGRLGAQNRLGAGEAFERWFADGPDLDAPGELIPAHLRALV